MKISCPCGFEIYDGPDHNPNIGHLIPDQDWSHLLDAIDAAVEGDHPTANAKEAACISVRYLIGDISRRMWQCPECGRLLIDDGERRIQEFKPATDAGKMILRGYEGGQKDGAGNSQRAGR